MRVQVEYLWIDGNKPTAKLRSKTKLIEDSVIPLLNNFQYGVLMVLQQIRLQATIAIACYVL
jgi:hypothetical protein